MHSCLNMPTYFCRKEATDIKLNVMRDGQNGIVIIPGIPELGKVTQETVASA